MLKQFLQNKKAQNWSLDLILAIVVFMLILSIFYLLLSRNNSGDIVVLKKSGEHLFNNLKYEEGRSSIGFIDESNNIDEERLKSLLNSNSYNELKKSLNIKGDFCIVLEDSNGRVVALNTTNGYVYGFGKSDINISGVPCGQTIN